MISKRADVLAVLEDKETTRSKLVIRNRRNSAAYTAFALMNPSDTRVRPHTAGQLQGMRPIERPGKALEGLGARSADSVESRGAHGPGHIATHDILHESRQRAMQSGGVDLQPSTPMGSNVLPAVGSPSPSGKSITHVIALADQWTQAMRLQQETRRLPNVAGLSISTGAAVGGGATATGGSTHSGTATGTRTRTDFDDELDHDGIDHEGDPSAPRVERETHTPFGSPSTAQRKESVTVSTTSAAETGAGGGARARRASLSLRGSLCIPASSSYADTLSRSNITPKSAMAIKLEASIDKYIYKKQQVT